MRIAPIPTTVCQRFVLRTPADPQVWTGFSDAHHCAFWAAGATTWATKQPQQGDTHEHHRANPGRI